MEWVAGQIDTTNVIGSATPAEYWPVTAGAGMPVVRKITLAELREAIREGLRDFAAARTDVIFLCLIYPLVGIFIAMAEAHGRLLPLLLPTAAGFVLIGPLAAVGLYEMSRQMCIRDRTCPACSPKMARRCLNLGWGRPQM